MTQFIQENGRRIFFLALLGLNFVACAVYSPPRTTAKDGSNAEELFRQDVIGFAKQHLGSSYKYAGRDPRGFDCSGFTHFVFNNYDISISPSSQAQEKEGESIPVKEAKTGDLIFFRRSKTGPVFHVALVVSNDVEGLQVIHSTSRGVVIDNISESSYWKPKISTARDVIAEKH